MIRIRPYRAKDRAACSGVFFRAVRDGAAGFYDADQRRAWAPSPTPNPEKPDKLLHQRTWVSEEGKAVTGFMSLTDAGHLDMAFVLPDVMGKGHAAALYEALLSHAQAAGMTRMTVHASEYSRRFLARRGWVVDAVEPHVTADGVIFQRCLMHLDLSHDVRPDFRPDVRPDCRPMLDQGERED